MVQLAIYPDNFTEETETTIQSIVNLSADPLMKACLLYTSTRKGEDLGAMTLEDFSAKLRQIVDEKQKI